MGLTKQSTGKGAVDNPLEITKLNSTDKIIALAGNPNVGKSTVLVVSLIWNGIRRSGVTIKAAGNFLFNPAGILDY